ncbi:MAG: site-2 protease family protein [Methanobacteriota archaeon]
MSEAEPSPAGPAFVDPLTLDAVRPVVERRFRVYDTRADEHVLLFYVQLSSADLEGDFGRLKTELQERGLVPILRYEGGEHAIFVVRKPYLTERGRGVNVALFLLTVLTTVMAGILAYYPYANPGADMAEASLGSIFAPANWFWGFLYFSLPLLVILGIHELGHYVWARRHRIAASLPFFIPLPPIFGVNIGTMGAFISMREPMPGRKALLDVGAAGPIAGFVVAIPITVIGLFLMAADPVLIPDTEGLNFLGTPLLYDLLARGFDFAENQIIHPTAFAGWVGLLVTGINLLPAGQLDGGHIAAALFGDRAKYLSYAAVFALVILGFGLPAYGPFPGFAGYGGWILMALLVAFMGVQHPPTLNNVTGIDGKRRLVGLVCLVILVLTFTPAPIQ